MFECRLCGKEIPNTETVREHLQKEHKEELKELDAALKQVMAGFRKFLRLPEASQG